MKKISVDKGVAFGDGGLVFIAGPCVIESREMALDLAKRLSALARKLKVGYVFKASFDKANRTSVDSYRGPGIEKGLEILSEIRAKFDVPVLTDVHEPWQCKVVADMRSLLVMRELGYPVVMDATHSVQRPGGLGTGSGGDGKYAPVLARAAVAVGVDGIFMETHPNPAVAKSDGANMLRLDLAEQLLATLLRIHRAANNL